MHGRPGHSTRLLAQLWCHPPFNFGATHLLNLVPPTFSETHLFRDGMLVSGEQAATTMGLNGRDSLAT
jgi:hypothetical protein